MSRHKTPPEALQAKQALAQRIIKLRIDLFGEHGKPEMARRLGIPVRSWYNYEEGVTIPGELLLKLIELTCVEPLWLLYGTGPMYRRRERETTLMLEPGVTPAELIRAALEILEHRASDSNTRSELDWEPRRFGARRGRSRISEPTSPGEESNPTPPSSSGG
jgi:hypothetical protein